jgi:hypothetical protein
VILLTLSTSSSLFFAAACPCVALISSLTLVCVVNGSPCTARSVLLAPLHFLGADADNDNPFATQ